MKAVLWDELNLDDPSNYHLALSCFFVGRGVEETRELLKRGSTDPEVRYVLETAAFSGLNVDSDNITRV